MQFTKRDINKQNRNGDVTFYKAGDSSSQSSSGGLTLDQVRRNFVSIDFFKRLFQAHDSTDSSNILNIDPNDTDSTITDIQFKFGAWSEGFISALGRNSSGGGGNVVYLNDLDDVDTTGASDGKVLTYQNGMWVPGTGGGGGSVAWADITNKPTTLSGYGITDAIPLTGSDRITGKLEPNTNNSIDLGSSDYRWRNVYGINGSFGSSLTVGGTNVSLAGHTHSASDITSGTFAAARIPTNISITGNAATATTASKLSTSSSYSIFGQTYWNNGVPQTVGNNVVGQMKYLSFRNNANTDNAGYVGAGSTANNNIALMAYSGNNLLLGAGGNTQATFDGSRLVVSSTTSDTPLRLKGNGSSTWMAFYNSSDTLLAYLGIDNANGGLRYSNGTSYWTVLHTGNCDNYVKALNNYYSSRPTSANISLGNGKLVYFMATNSMTTGKPASDAQILHMAWDNTNGWDTQVAVLNGANGVQYRGQSNGTWSNWYKLMDEKGGTFVGNIEVRKSTTADSIVSAINSNGTVALLASSNRGVYDITKGNWIIATNGTNTWLPNGNVGIGSYFNNNAPTQALHVSGNILATGGVTALSDMRQKSFLAGVSETMENLAGLPIFYFKWKAKDRDEYMHIGTSAQAVQKIFPELVLGKDELSVDYGVLGVTIGILNSRTLVTLEQRVTALESKLEERS